MKKIGLIFLSTLLLSQANAKSISVVGQGKFLHTHSLIANIIDERNAQTEALISAFS